jgi:putative CocE/NonD family hydrolase
MIRLVCCWVVSVCVASWPLVVLAESAPPEIDSASVSFQWDVKIPLRDGVKLSATVYTPAQQKAPSPCIFTLTPYIAQSYHDRGMYFAAHGYPFLTVDVRGRGNSEGVFHPLIQEAEDGYDIVEWLAKQPYCNGKVTMWGGSYAGYDQWATAKEFPPHLATIVPAAAPYAGVDFPMSDGVFYTYDMQWLLFVSGHTSQDHIFADDPFWVAKFRQWYESGSAFTKLDAVVGSESAIFQEWVAHPQADAYWDRYNPTAEQYSKLSIPILTITGSHDGDQPGALAHYHEYMKNASPEARARHYLVIGPWDHAGTRTPNAHVGGLTFGPASLVDLPKLHVDWYNWTMGGGPKPTFLKKNVAYYVMFADEWRYADSLEAVTGSVRDLHLDSGVNATDVLTAGSLSPDAPKGKPDHYVYDPRDVSIAPIEAGIDADSLIGQQFVYARRGKQLVYHSAPLEQDLQVSGFFRLTAWLSIDQPDTDFEADIYEIRPDGSSIALASQFLRARYRESARAPKLITTRAPQLYDFEHFTFVAQELKRGSRLRLVIGPVNSIHYEKNYNAGGVVASETMSDARPVTVTLYHDRDHQSTLHVPLDQQQTRASTASP